ncbi:MAG: Flp pilus assembly protein CpaB [Candidatus Omnitrophica bacterium]|nr:Flp pilus assembly protein CpaB [Candidatus Omnitrophota bacterium]
MDKRIINIIIGIVCAAGAILLIHGHIMKQEGRIQQLIEEGKAVRVVVARYDISRETTITEEMVTTKVVNRNALQPGDLTAMESVIGKFAEVDILSGQHINGNMIRAFGSFDFLSQAVKKGLRAITIPVDKLSAVEGLLKPQDKIDIVGTFNIPTETGEIAPVVLTIFQSVEVLATNTNISRYKTSKAIQSVTLALEPEDVRTLTFVMEMGRIKLVLRGEADVAQEIGYTAVTWDILMRKLGMYQEQPEITESPTISVYRGSDMEQAPVMQ